MIKISLFDANDFVTTVTLEGTQYGLHFAWNDRAGQWSFDLQDSKGNDLARGLAIVPNFPLLNQVRRNGLLRGDFMAIVVNSNDAASQNIGRKDFVQGKFSFVFMTGDEMDAIKSAAGQ